MTRWPRWTRSRWSARPPAAYSRPPTAASPTSCGQCFPAATTTRVAGHKRIRRGIRPRTFALTSLLGRPKVVQREHGAVCPHLAERGDASGVDSRDRRSADVGEHEASHTLSEGLPCHCEGWGVAPGSPCEPDWALPARRLSEHQVHPGDPRRELEELGRTGDASARSDNEVTVGGMRGMHDRLRPEAEAAHGKPADIRLEPVRGVEAAQ